MIDTKDSEWLTEFTARTAAAREKEALKAHSAEQRCCRNGHNYLFPDIIHPDTGGIFDAGIVGRYRIVPMAVCPECRVRVEEKETKNNIEASWRL